MAQMKITMDSLSIINNAKHVNTETKSSLRAVHDPEMNFQS